MAGAGLPDTSLGATVEVAELESLVKGELIVGDGSGAPSKLTVGADGCVLAALASEATGVRWATELKVSATAVTATVPYVYTGGTVAVSTPLLNAAQTWNDAGVTFIGAKIVVTDTASVSGSLAIQILGGAAGG